MSIDVASEMEPKPTRQVVARVGGVEIDSHQVGAEVQYHPAPSFAAAAEEATRALIVRELMLQWALSRGLLDQRGDERQEQAAIESVMQSHVPVPAVTMAQARDFYHEHRQRFLGPELYDASHILVPPAESGSAEGEVASGEVLAQQLLERATSEPHRFERLAERHSICPSAAQGGRLGQVSVGETAPEFEAALRELEPGEIAPRVIKTKHGYHVVRLNHRAAAQALPFEAVVDRIRIYLRDGAWRKALREFVLELAERFGVEGFDLRAATPGQNRQWADAAPAPAPRRLRVLA